MSSFRERWGSLTVEQILELNKKAQETCEEDSWMKINKTKIVFKFIKMIKDLEPEDWAVIRLVVDDLYHNIRLLEYQEKQTPEDDIEEIEEEIEGNKC